MNRSNNISNVAAVIPFYNEGKTINDVIEKTLKQVQYVIAVDDGSIDGSVQNKIFSEKVFVIKIPSNRGKGYALRTGMNKALEKGFSEIITLDADLQHNPDEIPFLLAGLKDYDIVVGNRLNNLKTMPVHRRMSNKITSALLSIKTGQRIIDSQCGYRAYRREVIDKVETIRDGYDAESEIIIKAARMGFKIGFADISTIYGDEKSKMNGFKATFNFIRLLFCS